MNVRKSIAVALVGMLTQPVWTVASGEPQQASRFDQWQDKPIKHLVVIFDENISFDHYFGTYPNALNPAGEPASIRCPTHRRSMG
jgi:phospholipase C